MAVEYEMLENGEFKLDAEGNKIPKVDSGDKKPVIPDGVDQKLLQELVQSMVADQLAPMKENLDKAYAARDEALRKADAAESSKKELEIERLREQGKHKEAHEAEIAEERSKRERAEQRALELTRDSDLRTALAAPNPGFRNKNAQNMAFKEIVGDLVQNSDGVWVHKDGSSIDDYVASYVTNEDNAFLLNQKVSSGAGTKPAKTVSVDDEKKSVFDRPQSEVLEAAEKGQLPHQQNS